MYMSSRGGGEKREEKRENTSGGRGMQVCMCLLDLSEKVISIKPTRKNLQLTSLGCYNDEIKGTEERLEGGR